MEAGVENANSIECIFKNNAQISCNANEELCNTTYQGLRTILKKCKAELIKGLKEGLQRSSMGKEMAEQGRRGRGDTWGR